MTPRSTRWSVAGAIARREARAAIRGPGGYVALAAAMFAATWIALVDVRALEAGGILVLADPFRPSMSAAILTLSLFLAVSAAVSAARERETGTLEVLFYGPVDEISYVAGKVGGLVIAYAAGLPIIIAGFALLSLMTGFALTPVVIAGAAVSVVPAAEVVGFGVLLSLATDRVRTAVILLIAVIAVLLGVTVAYSMVLLVPINDPASPVLPLRDTLAALDAALRWVSPFAYLERVVDGVASGAWRKALLSLALAIAYTMAMIVLAAWWLRRRGVHLRGD